MDVEKLVYPAKIVADGSGFVVTFRDLDNVFTEGDTYEEALFNAQEVLDILLLDMSQDAQEIPEPSPCRKGEIPVTVVPEVAVPILSSLERINVKKFKTCCCRLGCDCGN